MKKLSLISVLNRKFPKNTPEENYALIVCGNVSVGESRVRIPSEKIDPDAEISITKKKYVSRGGLKLERALKHWSINPSGMVVLDAGSSTGGFTDCLLQHGAKYVHSVDVGYNQIDYSLRKDSRVILHEKTNIMDVSELDPVPEMGVADLSFRSIVKAASKILDLVSRHKIVALVKPQFEARREDLRRGIVEDLSAAELILNKVVQQLREEESFTQDIISSPILGRKGNREFLFLITRDNPPVSGIYEDMIKRAVYSDNGC